MLTLRHRPEAHHQGPGDSHDVGLLPVIHGDEDYGAGFEQGEDFAEGSFFMAAPTSLAYHAAYNEAVSDCGY